MATIGVQVATLPAILPPVERQAATRRRGTVARDAAAGVGAGGTPGAPRGHRELGS